MNAEEREAIECANRLAQKLLDRDWLEQGVSQAELDQSLKLVQQLSTELDAGHSFDGMRRRKEKLLKNQGCEQENGDNRM